MGESWKMAELASLDDALCQLKGVTLSSVEFVQDYVQLRFDGPTLTAYTRPHLMTENKTIFWGDPNYWNVLRALIDVQVENARVCEGKELRLNFQNGTA